MDKHALKCMGVLPLLTWAAFLWRIQVWGVCKIVNVSVAKVQGASRKFREGDRQAEVGFEGFLGHLGKAEDLKSRSIEANGSGVPYTGRGAMKRPV